MHTKKGPTKVATSATFNTRPASQPEATTMSRPAVPSPSGPWKNHWKMDWLKGTHAGNHSFVSNQHILYGRSFHMFSPLLSITCGFYIYIIYIHTPHLWHLAKGCVMLEEISMGWLLIPLVAAKNMEDIRLFIDKLSQKLVKEHLWLLTGWLLRFFWP